MTEDERAKEELELKRQTLQLERDKFQFAQVTAFRDRMASAFVQAARGLMVAHASGLIFSLTYRDSIVKNFTSSIANFEVTVFAVGLFAAIGMQIEVLTMSAWSYQSIIQDKEKKQVPSIVPPMLALALLILAVLVPIIQLTKPDDILAIQNWFAALGKKS